MSHLQLTGAKESLFNESIRQEIDQWIAKYPVGQSQSAAIPSLHLLQDANGGWLSEEVMAALAIYLDMPAISIFEVATFYSMFDLKPVGDNKINICTNISCQLNGCADLVDHIQKKLGVGFGETTADGKYTLKEVECLGACCGAPMMQVNRDYHELLTAAKIDQILDGIN